MEIVLSNGMVSCIDKSDWNAEFVACHRLGEIKVIPSTCKWHATNKQGLYYACANFMAHGKRIRLCLHRVIMSAATSQIVDHKDANTLNNCRSNLRFATFGQNAQNKKTRKFRKWMSPFKGMQYSGGRWQAIIRSNNKRVCLGSFRTQLQAALAYDDAACRLHGEFARLNFPERQSLVVPQVKGLA